MQKWFLFFLIVGRFVSLSCCHQVLILCRNYFSVIMVFGTQDHGILRDGSKEAVDNESELARRTLSQDLNRHATVVLEGRASGQFLDLA